MKDLLKTHGYHENIKFFLHKNTKGLETKEVLQHGTYVPYKYLVLSSGIYPASNTVSTNMKIITCIRKNKTRKFLAK